MSGLRATEQCWSAVLLGRHSVGACHSSLLVIVFIPLSKASVSRKRLGEVFHGHAIDPRASTRQHPDASSGTATRRRVNHEGQLLLLVVKGAGGNSHRT